MTCTFFTAVYFQLLHTTFINHILLAPAIYYLRRYILLLVLPDCDFARIQDFPAISRICGLKAKLDLFENAILLEILKC